MRVVFRTDRVFLRLNMSHQDNSIKVVLKKLNKYYFFPKLYLLTIVECIRACQTKIPESTQRMSDVDERN